MSQPPGPQGGHPTLDYPPFDYYQPAEDPPIDYQKVDPRLFPRPGEPPIAAAKLPLHYQLTHFWGGLGLYSNLVQMLIRKKTGRAEGIEELATCDDKQQNAIRDAAFKSSKDSNHGWDWTSRNIGKYLASGLTQPTDLARCVELLDQEIKEFKEIRFDPKVLAQFKETSIYGGANERILENRIVLEELAKKEDRDRKDKQPTLEPLSQKSLADHTLAMSRAASDIQGKKATQVGK